MNRTLTVLKRLLVGRPISSHAELHHRLSKPVALAVFSSDALSSSAYATDEILLALMVAGALALSRSIPISIAVAIVLAVVVTSYTRTIRAYPGGGGAFIVAHENLGQFPGLIAAAALLIDYVLTVAVSVAAGVAAIAAAYPAFAGSKLPAAVAVVALITIANLRGLKESGTIFAIPTYGFLISIGSMIVFGVFKVVTGNYDPLPPVEIDQTQGLTALVLLTAFAKGSTALTGIEAMADGVPAFRPPEWKNAARTLITLGVLLTLLFVGITFLANAYRVNPELIESETKTIPSQIAGAIYGGGSLLFFVTQAFTALILFLAANTAYADFPRLSSILARYRYLPRVLQNRGDRLAFSNGIVILAVVTAAVLIQYRAELHSIIPLYVIGVFTSFTLSQSGMVVRQLRRRERGWRRTMAISGFGAMTTFVVLIIQARIRFTQGAWAVMLLILIVALLLRGVGRHYQGVADSLRSGPITPRIQRNRAVVLVSPYLGATFKSFLFARSFDPDEIRVVAFRVPERHLGRIRQRWQSMGIRTPIEATGHHIDDLVEYVRSLRPSAETPVTVIVPDPQFSNPVRQLLEGRLLLRIKRVFLAEPDVVVVSVPFRPDFESEPEKLRAPTRLSIIVVVAGVHRATVHAIRYAQSLKPSELKALTISLDPADTADLLRRWHGLHIDIPLEIVDSPYRSLIQPLLTEIRALRPSPTDLVAVVVPEFIVSRWWQHLLHGQTAFMIKATLLFEPNVVVIDVPYPLAARTSEQETAQI